VLFSRNVTRSWTCYEHRPLVRPRNLETYVSAGSSSRPSGQIITARPLPSAFSFRSLYLLVKCKHRYMRWTTCREQTIHTRLYNNIVVHKASRRRRRRRYAVPIRRLLLIWNENRRRACSAFYQRQHLPCCTNKTRRKALPPHNNTTTTPTTRFYISLSSYSWLTPCWPALPFRLSVGPRGLGDTAWPTAGAKYFPKVFNGPVAYFTRS